MRFRKFWPWVALLCFSLGTTWVYAGWKTAREQLEHVHIVGDFRLFYSTEGENALPAERQKDLNGNGIPDFVEDVGIQLIAGIELFTGEFGFVHPLHTDRYRDKVQYIDVHFLEMEGKGSSGDGVVTYRYEAFGGTPSRAITITLSNNLRTGSVTPLHELFHAYQNGATMFKNRWYTEGTARWAESTLSGGKGRQSSLPATAGDLEEWLSKTYGAGRVWNRLARLCSRGEEDYPRVESPLRYVTTGGPVFVEKPAVGFVFFRTLLAQFGRMDKRVSALRGRPIYDWEEAEQRSEMNNPYLMCALRDTISLQCPRDQQEISGFLYLLEVFAGDACKGLGNDNDQ